MKSTLLALSCLLLSSSAHAQSACPLNHFQCNGHEFSSYAPTYDLTCQPELGQTGSATTTYNLTFGLLTSHTWGRELGAGAVLELHDDYVLSSPDSTCLSFAVSLQVNAKFTRGGTGADGDLIASIKDSDGNGPGLALFTKVSTVMDTVLTLSITRCPGSFQVSYELNTGAGWGDCYAEAYFTFS